MDSFEDFLELTWLQSCRSSTAQIDGIHVSLDFNLNSGGEIFRALNFLPQPGHVTAHPLSSKHSGGKVAEAAFRAAERDGNVDSNSHLRIENVKPGF
jgi:hypothetical protein